MFQESIMSTKSLERLKSFERFLQLVLEDEVLQARFQEAPDQESLVNLAVELGREKGYDFTADEVRQELESGIDGQQITYPIGDLEEIVMGY